MRSFQMALLATALLVCGVGQVKGAPITYVFTTTATGTLGGTPFSNALLTFTFTGDTNNVTQSPGPIFFLNPTATATLNVPSIGLATINPPTYVFDCTFRNS